MAITARNAHWRLTVHWFPHVADEGVRPIIARSFGVERIPGEYRPHDFDFAFPPSRKDFIETCKRHLPWTACWKDDLLPLIEQNKCDWPMIDTLHKGSSVIIQDKEGREIGKLEVWRREEFENEPYQTLYIPVELRDSLTQGYKGDARQSVRDFVDACENQIREALSLLGRPPEESDVKREIRNVIALWKTERAKAGNTSEAVTK